MDDIVIELPGIPRGKGRPRFSRRSGHAYTPEKTRSYESLLQGAAIEVMKKRKPLDGPLLVKVEAYFPVPASWSRPRRAAALLGLSRPVTRPDADNLMKMLDSFNAVVWRDDSQVVEGIVCKHYSEQPRLVVRVGKLG